MRTQKMNRQIALEAELKRIISLIVSEYQPEAVYLYGSLATGEITDWSDLDLIIVKETDEAFLDRVATVLINPSRVGPTEPLHHQSVNCHERAFPTLITSLSASLLHL